VDGYNGQEKILIRGKKALMILSTEALRHTPISKRLFDLVVATVSLILLSPVFLILAYLIKRKLGSPVIFSQIRPGLHAKPFNMFKFRTMTEATDSLGNLLPDSERMTRLGQLLRLTSLDELPELWNVFKGEMSLVGPRPLLMEYLPLYNQQQMRRHEVKPGITGWSQVNGRNVVTWDMKFKMDVWYVDHRSFCLDLKILFLTVLRVIARKDINAIGHVTAEKFTGNER
jgi:lipopolysaccharide/colanic/teichoic acid biosynthesis glycosyltransferase